MAIELHDHDPDWMRQADSLVEELAGVLGAGVSHLEHVGSTAIPGIAAKPKLHIDAMVEPGARLEAVRELLRGLGYADLGCLHRTGEVQLTRPAAPRFSGKTGKAPDLLMAHRLCLCPPGSAAARERRLFRDALRRNRDLAYTYEDLKRRLAVQFGRDAVWDRYNQGKTDFIQRVVKAALQESDG